MGAHSMAVGDDLACERFRRQLEIRSLARKTSWPLIMIKLSDVPF